MRHCIVIGNPIAHSKSPIIHHEFARQLGVEVRYERQFCPNDVESFKAVVDAFFNGGGVGANVTLPFKEMAFDLCQSTGELSDFARTAGAVNTLAIKDGKLYGDNTDGRGLVADLLSKGVELNGKSIAILGAGGATRGAILPLLQAGVNSITIFNRTLAKAQQLVDIFTPFASNQKLFALPLTPQELTGHFDVIINATSAGTTGQTVGFDNADITTDVAYDMMYGKETEFLTHFQGQAVCHDGMGMLIHQAVLSFGLWMSVDVKSIDLTLVEKLLVL
ncbi:MAG: shikimate dehydrogenase [Moraxella sp.]|uniref:shikimate dehydrogenase n=1 Tax=Moraxella sp. TaxID=479 RepID=UPI0026DA7DA1|nr:shikimate dehydrogenase [Moraxella sp.]MDO4450895.1 shikimate dehydrogenase [Moraxella sp.]